MSAPTPPAPSAAAYPLPAYNFRVTVGDTTMSFSEVSGINVKYETVTYSHGLSFIEGDRITSFRHDKFVPVTLKRGTVAKAGALYQWLESKEARRLEVSLCDERGAAAVTWVIRRALPTKLEAPTFDAGTNEVALESLEVMASGISVEYA